MAWHFIPVSTGYDWSMLIMVQLLVIMLMRGLVDHRFHYFGLYSLSHPVGISFMLLCGIYGVIRRFTGAGVYWKQRLYTPESGIE